MKAGPLFAFLCGVIGTAAAAFGAGHLFILFKQSGGWTAFWSLIAAMQMVLVLCRIVSSTVTPTWPR